MIGQEALHLYARLVPASVTIYPASEQEVVVEQAYVTAHTASGVLSDTDMKQLAVDDNGARVVSPTYGINTAGELSEVQTEKAPDTVTIPAGHRYFKRTQDYTPLLLKIVANFPNEAKALTKRLDIWEFRCSGELMDGHWSLQVPREQAVRWLGLFGYCEHAAKQLMDEGLIEHHTGIYRDDNERCLPYIKRAFGPDLAALCSRLYEQLHDDSEEVIKYPDNGHGLLAATFPDIPNITQWSNQWMPLVLMIELAALYQLHRTGKIKQDGIELPPAGVGITAASEGQPPYLHYWEDGHQFDLPLSEASFTSKANREAYADYVRLSADITEARTADTTIRQLAIRLFIAAAIERSNAPSGLGENLRVRGSNVSTVAEVLAAYRSNPLHPCLIPLLEQLQDPAQARQWAEDRILYSKHTSVQDRYNERVAAIKPRLLAAYLMLVKVKDGERAANIQKARQYTKAHATVAQLDQHYASKREIFTPLAAGEKMLGLPAHFAAIPAGLNSTLRVQNDGMGKPALMIVSRELDLSDDQARQHTHLEFDLRPDNATHLADALNTVFANRPKASSPAWVIPLVISAVMRFYRENSGNDHDNSVRMFTSDLIDWLREGTKPDLRGQAFGRNYNAHDLIRKALLILEHLTYRRKERGGITEVHGMIKVWRTGTNNRGQHWFDIGLSPEVLEGLHGSPDNRKFMYHNVESMRGYRRNELDFNPAAQLALEHMANIVVPKRKDGRLLTGRGDGWGVLTVAEHLGLMRSTRESHDQFRKRLTGVLDTQVKYGTLSSWAYDGREMSGTDYTRNKLVLTFGDDLVKLNSRYEARRELERVEGDLHKPGHAPAAKRRGRKPKGG